VFLCSRAINRPGYRGGAVDAGDEHMKMRMIRDTVSMRWRAPVAALAFAALLSAIPAPAAAVRYLGTRSVGSGSVDLSIDTDGKIGALTAADIVAWTVTLHDPSGSIPLHILTNDGASGSLRSTVVIGGPTVTATSTALSFTYGLGDLEFDANYTIRPFYQIVSRMCATGGFGETRACEQFDTGSDYYSSHAQYSFHASTGTIVIGTAAAVPEPAAWSLMIVGFGLVGGLSRARSMTNGSREIV
jgi:hypothetical protein